jgi:hypothetical protein
VLAFPAKESHVGVPFHRLHRREQATDYARLIIASVTLLLPQLREFGWGEGRGGHRTGAFILPMARFAMECAHAGRHRQRMAAILTSARLNR